MSKTTNMYTAIEGLRADRDALIAIAIGLSAVDWESPSGCEGWTTKDLVSHLASTFWSVVDGTVGPDTSGLGFEEAVDLKVQARRSMTPAEVLADYEAVSLRAFEVLPALAGLDVDVPFGDDELYPAALVPAAFCFDHYTHIRADLFAPRGCIVGQSPPSDEMRLAPTLDWIEAAIPEQNRALLASLSGQIDLIVTGPGSREVSVGSGGTVAVITSDSPSFVRWVTGRSRWEELDVTIEGDADAVETARSLRVY